jgi:hypothetical protein
VYFLYCMLGLLFLVRFQNVKASLILLLLLLCLFDGVLINHGHVKCFVLIALTYHHGGAIKVASRAWLCSLCEGGSSERGSGFRSALKW